VSAAILAAAAAFLASLGGAYWLGRVERTAVAFASLVAAPLIGALGFAAVAMLPTGTSDARTPPTAAASGGSPGAAPSVRPDAVDPRIVGAPGGGPAVESWRREAEELRHARRFAEARVLYAKLAAATPEDADAWADLADASAAAAGGDLRAGAEALGHALQLDPAHPKALWLKASLELQEKHYASAIGLWQRLLERLPPDSNDARIVSANLEETRALAARPAVAPAAPAGDGR
jgi:tetratricopeptide (TPR) repeat protein